MILYQGLRWIGLGCLPLCLGPIALVAAGQIAGTAPSRKNLKEPIYRVTRASKTGDTAQVRTAPAPPTKPVDSHPLDPALEMAANALAKIDSSIRDYTCTIVKQERVNGVVLEPEYMFAKIRNRQMEGNRVVVPFSVYMKFLKPAAIKGREVIYIENQNAGKLVAHEGGLKGKFLPTVWLKPEGTLAMRKNRYPITEIGIVTLTKRLIERGNLDRQHADCTVEFKRATINKRKCTCLQLQHPVRRPHFDFYVERVFIDDEMGVPVRYEAYDWPPREGSQPQLIEAYTYLNMRLNVGLTDMDFNHENVNYNF